MNANSELSAKLDEYRPAITRATVEALVNARPELFKRYGESGKRRCEEDTQYHLQYLSEAIAFSSQQMFVDYIAWVKATLAARNIPREDLAQNLVIMRDAVAAQLQEHVAAPAIAYIDAALRHLTSPSSELPSYLDKQVRFGVLAHRYLDALLAGERQQAGKLIADAVKEGISIRDIYMQVLQISQYEMGRLWQANLISVAQEHYCTAATQLIMSSFYPSIIETERNGRRLVATSVSGDLHELGIRMVSDFFEMEGWDTYYLGANTPTAAIIQALIGCQAEMLAVSATIPLYVRAVAELIRAVRANKETGSVKILVGGHPFNQNPELWKEIAADGMARNAEEAVIFPGLHS